MNQLTSEERDQLVEVVSIGGGNASTSLSKLLNRKITFDPPIVEVDKIENIPALIGDQDELKSVILLKTTGDISGTMLLILDPESAVEIAGFLTKDEKKDVSALDDLDYSALKEVGNIITGSSLNSLSKFLGITFPQSIPDIATDMLGSMVDGLAAEIGEKSDFALLFKINFKVPDSSMALDLHFLFEPEATKRILSILETKLGN